jgi:hypothetical protein
MSILKKLLPVLLLFAFAVSKAQKIDSIYVNLYTDSLKKGTYNYINIVGLLQSGKYLPLDTTQLIFNSSYGKFYGNSLLIDKNCKVEKVDIHVILKKNPALARQFTMYIKKKEDNEHLPTKEEIIEKMKKKGS